MSISGNELSINAGIATDRVTINNGNLTFDSNGFYDCNSKGHLTNSYGYYIAEAENDIRIQSHNGNVNIISDHDTIQLLSNSNSSNAIILNAINVSGGINMLTGTGGFDITTSNGDISLLSQGANINIGVSPPGTLSSQQTQNITIECFNNLDVSAGDMYFVSSDIISIISNTGDINIGSSANGTPVIKIQNGNLLINQSSSDQDYQVDIAVTEQSNAYPGYNGLMVTSFVSNVAADITLQTSNTLGDGTQCVLSMGAFGSDNDKAFYKPYFAYQTGNQLIRLDGPTYSPGMSYLGFGQDFSYNDIGKTIFYSVSNRQDTITSLSTYITSTNDPSNVAVNGTFNGSVSQIYLLQIDSVGTPNTFMWSNNGGLSFQKSFIPIVLIPITLDNGLSVTFSLTTGFSLNQQFCFQTKITALVTSNYPPTDPEYIYTIQPFHAYIKTTTPADIVIKTNNTEKMRITGDGAIGIQQRQPMACLDLNSNYNKVILVNQIVNGYQINPSVSYLSSGGYVIVWNSQDNPSSLNFDVYGQRYLADGSINGINFRINQTTSNNQSFPSISGQRYVNSNHYIVVWSSLDTITNLNKIYCQIYHNNTAISPNDIQIDATNPTTSNQLYARTTGLYNGNYFITWAADDTGAGLNPYVIQGAIISDNGSFVVSKLQISSASNIYSCNYPYPCGLPNDDTTAPNGIAVGYMVAMDNTNHPRYTISTRLFYSNGTPLPSGEIPITSVGNASISSITDGLLSLSEINLFQVNPPLGNGGFCMSFYRSYQADTSLYNIGDNVTGLQSGATATISALNGLNKVITLQNVSNRFLIDEEIEIISSNVAVGIIIEKIDDINFLTLTTANVTLDTGSKNVVAYRFPTDMTQANDAIWNIQVNTSPLYEDTERFSGNVNVFQYKRPLAAISTNHNGYAIVSWSNDSIPSVYYQIINVADGSFQGIEQRLTSAYNGFKQRDQVVTQLQSLENTDYGFVISWDNQCLDLLETGVYQQLIGFDHSLFNLEDGNSNFIFNHQNQCGIGTNDPLANLHIKSQLTSSFYDPPNPASVIIQNTSQHVITDTTGLQNITFQNGLNQTLASVKSGNSLRYNDLYPLPENLIGFYKFDETQGTQVRDSSAASGFLQLNSPIFINTSGILENFDIENCWNPGIINNSLLFNGVDNYCFVENTATNGLNTILETANQLSLSVWVNVPSNVNINSHYTIVSNGYDFSIAGTYALDLLDISSNGLIYPTANISVNGVSIRTITGSIPINDATWHHLGFTSTFANGNCTIAIYIDGVLNNSNTAAGVINSIQHASYKTFFGSSNGSNRFFRGYMDELRFYNTTLSADQIAKLYYYGNPNIEQRGSLFLNPNASTSFNLGVILDDKGNFTNLGSRPLPYSILSGELVAFQSNANIYGIGTSFTTEVTVGDIITLDIANNLEYSVVDIASDSFLTLDQRAYTGPEPSKPYQSVLRRPSIYTFFDNDDNVKGNIDNYGNMIIGNAKPSTMFEVSGQTGNSKNIPQITITNTSIESTLFSRKTSINFRGYDATNVLNPPVTLGHIEMVHDGISTNNKGIMRFFTNDGTQENNVISLTSSGYIGIGGENTPLGNIHIASSDTSNDCSIILQSSFTANIAANSIFDERNNIYFAGITSITETLDPNIRKKVLAAVSGSNDSDTLILNGRLDFLTNNEDPTVTFNGIESRMSITHSGNVGVNILNPPMTFSVAPERRLNNQLNTITNAIFGGTNTTLTISNNIFSGLNTQQRSMFIGGTVVIENNVLTISNIVSVTGNNTLVVVGNLSNWIGSVVHVHYPGLNVDVTSGYIGLNTKTLTSPNTISGGVSHSITTVSGTVTLDSSYYTVICDTSGAAVDIYLPSNSASISGRIYRIKNGSTSGNLVTVYGNGSNIDGAATQQIQYLFGVMGYNTFQSDGTNWWIV